MTDETEAERIDRIIRRHKLSMEVRLRIYVAGPMRGIPEFNFPAFHKATARLRSLGHTVFNPAERDNDRHGVDISKGNLNGSVGQAEYEHGFNLREALGEDLEWICRHADAICLLPGWKSSKGACAEKAVCEALGLNVCYIGEFLNEQCRSEDVHGNSVNGR